MPKQQYTAKLKEAVAPGERPVRVLFVSHDGGMAGAQRCLLELLRSLDRRCFDPFLVVPDRGLLESAAVDLGVPTFQKHMVPWLPALVRLGNGSRLGYLIRTLRTLKLRAWAIAALIEQHRIDVVYTNTIVCVEGAVAARMSGRPHVWHIHEPVSGNSELAPALPQWLYETAVRRLSAKVIVPSKGLLLQYPRLSPISTVVYNGLPHREPRDRSAARRCVAQALEFDDKLQVVGVVGALQPRKDHLTFLRAARRVASQRSGVVFLIVGTGAEGYTSTIREHIRELDLDSSVKLVGWWPGDIQVLMAGIDVLVVSSEQESFGLTIIEALATETPVIATRCGGPEEIIEDECSGLLVPVRNPSGLASAIERILADADLARRLGVSGRRRVVERFGSGQYIHGVEKTIRSVAPSAILRAATEFVQ